MILKKGKQIEKDIFINTGKIKIVRSFVFGIYLKFDACDLLFLSEPQDLRAGGRFIQIKRSTSHLRS